MSFGFRGNMRRYSGPGGPVGACALTIFGHHFSLLDRTAQSNFAIPYPLPLHHDITSHIMPEGGLPNRGFPVTLTVWEGKEGGIIILF